MIYNNVKSSSGDMHASFWRNNAISSLCCIDVHLVLPLFWYTISPYITNIIYNYDNSIIFQIYRMAAILILFALPAYSYTNCTYVCCNDYPLLFFHFNILHAHITNIILINIKFLWFFRFIAWRPFWFFDPTIIYLL